MRNFIYLIALLLCATLSACGYDEPKESMDTPNSNSVIINTDGSTSTGVVFFQIDETSFFLDYVKYQIVDSHLEIVGCDPIEIKENVNIFDSVNYLGSEYKVRKIASDAFARCKKIKSIRFPNTLQIIESHAFELCSGLTSLSFPDELETIEWAAFIYCDGLTSISFPKSLKTLGSGVFDGCKRVTSVTIFALNPPKYTGGSVFDSSIFEQATLYVPTESVDLYKNDIQHWGRFSNIIGI